MKASELFNRRNITLTRRCDGAFASGVHQSLCFDMESVGDLFSFKAKRWPSINGVVSVDFKKVGCISKLKFNGKIQSRRRFKKLIKELINASKRTNQRA